MGPFRAAMENSPGVNASSSAGAEDTAGADSAGAEEALKITNYHIPTMEEALEFIDDDELVEITPKSIRMRKRELNAEKRKKAASRK